MPTDDYTAGRKAERLTMIRDLRIAATMMDGGDPGGAAALRAFADAAEGAMRDDFPD